MTAFFCLGSPFFMHVQRKHTNHISVLFDFSVVCSHQIWFSINCKKCRILKAVIPNYSQLKQLGFVLGNVLEAE